MMGAMSTVPAALAAILRDERLDPSFPAEVEAEAAALVAAPGLDDPALADLTGVPFVTVDGEGTRDLDQALYLERDGNGFLVRYAIADACHYVRPGSALFAEALRRGTSFYLPGLSVPMLPRALSEGAVSLNPEVLRRALVFDLRLDGRGALLATRVLRARLRSRARLSFDEVQAFLDAPATSPLAGRDFAASLALLPVVGRLRQNDAAVRQVVRFHREEVAVGLDGTRFIVTARVRQDVEAWNEQLSLLCNAEGGRLLCAGVGEATSQTAQAIYRVHPAPRPERLAELSAQLAELARLHGLDPARWAWRPGTSLADWVATLPDLATTPAETRVARAAERQAVMVNVRSTYSAEPSEHHGVGAEPYARFTAPMREIVGVFVHKEACELLGLTPRAPGADDVALRDQVIDAANRAREQQRRLTNHTNLLAIDHVLGADAVRTPEARPFRRGTVMGVTPAKIHVTFDDPPIDVKLYVADAGRALGPWLSLSPGRAALVDEQGAPVLAVGDAIDLRVVRHDTARDRWVLEPAARPRPAAAR